MTSWPFTSTSVLEFEELPPGERVSLPSHLRDTRVSQDVRGGGHAEKEDRMGNFVRQRSPVGTDGARRRGESRRLSGANEDSEDANGRVFVTGDDTPIRFAVQYDGKREQTVERTIEANGGVIVREMADFILVKRGTSCSHGEVYYTYSLIDECIRQNRMLEGAELDRFRVQPTGGRIGRKAFTEKEDRELMGYLRALPAGKRKGNQAYQEFAAKRPKSGHTWQSWRYRALKKILPAVESADEITPTNCTRTAKIRTTSGADAATAASVADAWAENTVSTDSTVRADGTARSSQNAKELNI